MHHCLAPGGINKIESRVYTIYYNNKGCVICDIYLPFYSHKQQQHSLGYHIERDRKKMTFQGVDAESQLQKLCNSGVPNTERKS